MRPGLLFVCHPLTGHVMPILRIARGLRQRGWNVAFLSSEFFRARIEAADVQFLPLLGDADLDDAKLFDRHETGKPVEGLADAENLPQSITDLRHQTLAALPAEWHSVKAALTTLAEQRPGERLLLVSEAFFYGSMPLKYGAEVPTAVANALIPRTVCLSITAPAVRSIDLPPFGSPGVFDSSSAGRTKNAQTWDSWLERVVPLTKLLRQKMLEAGATNVRKVDEIVFLGGSNYICHDAIGQIGIPEFEYPRCDFPSGFRVVGIVPPVIPAAPPSFPWWGELVRKHESGTKVVVVAQGTVETEPTELILPTLQLLGHRDDVLTVAILGSRGAKLSADVALPRNAHVADYLAYDAVLPYADLWVHNGGYGATMHGIAHGVAMVIAGDGQDKPETGKRVQYSGLGIDLACARPKHEDLEAAITTVLSDGKFSAVAKSMQKTAKDTDCFENVEKMILEEVKDA